MILNWEAFHNLRHVNPLWMLELCYPFFYIIIITLALTIGVCFWYDVGNRSSNIFLLILFSVILTGTPYFVSGLVRFPDTFGVISRVDTLSEILNSSSISYANSYPIAYLLMYIIISLTQIDLYLFTSAFFSPWAIVLIVILWYIYINKRIHSKSAIFSVVLAIPLLIIEMSITPFTIAMIFILTALFLFSFPTLTAKISMLIIFTALIISHPFGILLLLSIIICSIILKYSYNKYLIKEIQENISFSIILIGIISWFSWTLFQSTMGHGIMNSLIKVLSLESTYVQQFSTYSVGNAGLIYPWIQQLNMMSYLVYALLIIIVISAQLLEILKTKNINLLKRILTGFGYESLFLLFMTAIFLVITLIFLLLLTGGEQLTSRSLNLMVFAATAYLGGASWLLHSRLMKRRHSFNQLIPVVMILLLISVIIIFPLHSYSRESYVSYSESYCAGRDYSIDVVRSSQSGAIMIFSESEYYGYYMRSQVDSISYLVTQQKTFTSTDYTCIYSNKYYNIHLSIK